MFVDESCGLVFFVRFGGGESLMVVNRELTGRWQLGCWLDFFLRVLFSGMVGLGEGWEENGICVCLV